MNTKRRLSLIASGCLAAVIVGASSRRDGINPSASFVVPRLRCVRARTATSPPRAAADEIVNPLTPPFEDATACLLPPVPPSWGVADDWSRLSDAAAASAAFMPLPSSVAGLEGLEVASHVLAEQENMMSEWEGANAEAVSSESLRGASRKTKNDLFVRATRDDDFVENALEAIASRSDYFEADGVQLYDTMVTGREGGAVKSGKDRRDDEMAVMIRCDQSPEQLLIDEGKALPELTEERKYAPAFLLAKPAVCDTVAADGSVAAGAEEDAVHLPLQAKATPFLAQAVTTMFEMHAVRAKDASVLDRKAIARWMTRCLSSPVGSYDGAVSAILSRYSQSHGSGRLTHAEFQTLYLEVAWSGYLRDLMHRRTALDPARDDGNHLPHPRNGGGRYRLPTLADASVLIQGKKNTEKMLQQATVALVWRDLEAHGIFSPAEQERVRRLLELEQMAAEIRAAATAVTAKDTDAQLFVDECVLFDDYVERLSHHVSHNGDDDALATEDGWDFLARRKGESSHEAVEMASDGETPLRIRDGQFVFIDEESCIGCKQCANIAPSSFKMLEQSGRARSYSQSNAANVENAVMACPVSCMHHVSFDELKEMETARDDGDGRTDHRHFGGTRITHTPLHLSRRDSDANHKSSWYHYLKGKCHTSTCPDRGCYDCPQYAPGQNPSFKKRHMRAELIRAKDFIASGEADRWRKVVSL